MCGGGVKLSLEMCTRGIHILGYLCTPCKFTGAYKYPGTTVPPGTLFLRYVYPPSCAGGWSYPSICEPGITRILGYLYPKYTYPEVHLSLDVYPPLRPEGTHTVSWDTLIRLHRHHKKVTFHNTRHIFWLVLDFYKLIIMTGIFAK